MPNYWSLIDRAVRESRTLSGRIRAVHSGVRNHRSFERWLAEVKDQAYDWRVWGAAFTMAHGCSDDAFSDFRSWLVLQGSAVFNRALQDPDTLVDVACDDPFTEELGTHVPAESPAGREWTPRQAAEHLPRLTAWRAAEDRRLGREPIDVTRPTEPKPPDTATMGHFRRGLHEGVDLAREALAGMRAKGQGPEPSDGYLYAHYQQPGAFELVASCGVSPNARLSDGRWVLFAMGSVDNLRKLIELGAEVTSEGPDGQTALFYYQRQPACIELLLAHGLDRLKADDRGYMPHQVHTNPRIREMLTPGGAASGNKRSGKVVRRRRK